MQNLLELKGISRRVSDRFTLRDVTLAVEPARSSALLVPTVLAKQRRFELLSGL